MKRERKVHYGFAKTNGATIAACKSTPGARPHVNPTLTDQAAKVTCNLCTHWIRMRGGPTP